jgi:hypothetical protein
MRNREQTVRSHLLHSSVAGVAVHAFAVPSTSHSKLSQNAGWVKTILARQIACFDFCSSNFNLQDHLLSTSGAGLRASSITRLL